MNFKDPRGLCKYWADDYGWKTDWCGSGGSGSNDMETVNDGPPQKADPGGGGQAAGPFNPFTIPGFSQALSLALSALATPDCAGLFGFAANSMNPNTLLTSGVSAAVAGAASALQFGTTTNPKVSATTAMAGIVVATKDPWAYTNLNGQAVESTRVVININLANWAAETTIQQAQTLIHELGHAFNELLGAGGSAFVYDALPNGDPNPQAEATNAALVQKCIHN